MTSDIWGKPFEHVIWIDPGETVGWVTATVRRPSATERLHDGEMYDWEQGISLQIHNYDNTKMWTFAQRLLQQAFTYDVIGFETYAIRPDKLRAHAGSTVPTLQLIGAIRLAHLDGQRNRADGFPQLVEQSPNDKTKGRGAARLHFDPEMNAVIDEALEGKHDDGHYGDALLHLANWYHERYFEPVK